MGSIVIKDNQKFSEAEECLDRIKKFINDESNNSIESYKQSIEELERFLPQLKEKQLLIQGYKKLIDLYTKLATKIFTQKTEFLEKANNYFQKIIELEQGDSLSCNELTKKIVKETQFIKNPDPIRIELPKAEFRSIKTTKELAMLLIDLPKSSMQYSDLTNLALVVIEEFSHKYVKTREFINEVEILSIVNNLEIIKALLSQFINAIERDVLLDPNVLNDLAQILCNSNPELLDPDDLTKILKVINERLDNLHQKGSEDKLLSLIKSIAKVLVAMADANVKGLSRTEQHDPLYDSLSKLISSFDVVEFFLEQKPNFHVRQFALYARQALVRIPNDETKLQSAIRRIIKIGKGVNALNSAFQQKSPSELLGAFKEFKEAFKCKVSQKEWFDNLRYAEMLIASNNFTIFEKFIKENSNCYMQESMFYGIISLLKQTIEDHFDINVRCCAVKLLSQLWQAYVKLRNNMEDVIAIKDYCNEYLTLQDGGYIGKHEDIHRWISEIFLNRTKFDPRYELEIVFQEEVEKLKSILSEYPKESLSNHCFHEIAKRSDSDQQLTLLEEAKWKKELQDKIKNISYRMSEEYVRDIVVDKISKLKNKVLSNKYIMDELKLYVDILAATKMDYEAKQPFDLTKRIEQWLKLDDKDKVFLLSGDAGIGKTIFNRHLEVILWKKCESNNFVPSVLPFFVPLGSLERVEDNFIEEYFQKYLDREFDSGFNKKDIDILKRDYKVIFILDGYDEIKLQTNLYEKYFKQWNAKIIISCRSDYLIKNKNYIEMFAPNDVCKELQNFSEAYILPFKEMQVKEYIDKYLSINFNYVNKDDIEAKIKKIPGLKELICTPFILMISIEIVPNLFEQNFANLQSSSNKITKAILLDKFINKLFEREKNKLRTGYKFYKDGWEDNLYITEDFWEFSTELAITMHKNNLNEIYYVPRLFGKNKRSHFEDFFGNSTDIYQAEKLRKVRDACGCILKTVGKNRRAFIYPGLKEYFVGRSILLEEEDKSTNNKQSTMMFTNFYANNIEVMKNLADRVLESKTLREKFLNYIEKSKNNKEYSIAAANAITALNYANVHFYEINFEDIDITSADLNKSFFYKCDFSRANLSKVNLQGASFIRCELNKTNFSEVYFGELPYIKLEEPAKDLSLYKDLLCVIGSKKVRIYEYNNKEVLWKCIKERYPLSPHDFIKGGVLNNCILVLNDHYTLEYNDKWYDLDFGSESEHNICLADHGKIFLRKSGNKFEYIVSNPLNNELNTNILDIDSTRFVDIDNTRFELSDKINAFS